jgi:hypothetical protein
MSCEQAFLNDLAFGNVARHHRRTVRRAVEDLKSQPGVFVLSAALSDCFLPE